MCFIAFQHRENMLTALKSHPNGKIFDVNGQAVSIVEARMRGDELTADETAEHPPREILWDKYNRQVAHTSRTPPHIVLRDDGTVLQQHAGDSCVCAAIAHGLPHKHTAKTLRDEVI